LPSIVARALVGETVVVRIEIMVVFPAPFGPSRTKKLSGLHLEGDAVDSVRLGLLVALHEVFDADHALSI